MKLRYLGLIFLKLNIYGVWLWHTRIYTGISTITPKYATMKSIKQWDGNKKHMEITNKGYQSRAKERLEWIMGLTRATDGGQRSQGQPDFHHPVYWRWAEMSKGIKLAGGENKINAAVETLCTSSPAHRNIKEWSCQYPPPHHPSMYSSLYVSFYTDIAHMVILWVNLHFKVLHNWAEGVSFATVLLSPLSFPHHRRGDTGTGLPRR